MKIRASGRPIGVYITKIMEVLQPITSLDCKVNFKKKKKRTNRLRGQYVFLDPTPTMGFNYWNYQYSQ